MSKDFSTITAHFDEARQSQLPFVEVLINMGYTYISREEVSRQRGGDTSKFLLKDVAFEALSRINNYEYNGEIFTFSEKDIREAIAELENISYEGLIDTSKNIFYLLMPTTGGKSIRVFHDGKAVSKNFRFIDSVNPKNNSFHVTVEYEATGRGNIRPDIVVFVNGIPFAIAENKKAGVEIGEALAQQVRNQGAEKCPRLFTYPQLLIATNGSEFRYGTTGTPEKFYAVWKEKDVTELDRYITESEMNAKVEPYIRTKIRGDIYAKLLLDLNGAVQGHVQQTNRVVTVQDRSIISLFSFERFLDLCKNYILFDGGTKIMSRYQQYFAIHKMLKRIENRDSNTGKREGGLVWHTQGSGKSLTMVLFVKALIEDPNIKNPRVIIVTDRKDLDKQISETFKNCNLKKEVYRTATGEDLLAQIENKNLSVLTTLVHKFDAAGKKRDKFIDPDDNIFVLIDEAHRTQSGIANMEMTRIIPNACYIGFTGTPLMKAEKASYLKFGTYIDKYTIDHALNDKVILPLIYEGRYVELEAQDEHIDKKSDRVLEPLNAEDKSKMQKFASKKIIKSNPGIIEEIANDIEKHFIEFFQGTGIKAQIVAPTKFAAITFQNYFERNGKVRTAIVISDEQDITHEEDERKKEVDTYLKGIKEKYASLESYEKDVIDSFKYQEEGVEIIIVVDKLLTGFDAPRNTVLYLAKDLKDHTLLQAIARVNRLFDNEVKPKTAGFIIDYSENAKNLQQAMQLFGNFDAKDVEQTLIDVDEKIKELEAAYASTHDFFNGIKKDDSEALLQSLVDPVDREAYYDHVRKFVQLFNKCFSLQEFPLKFDKKIDLYKRELKTFLELRKAASTRYADEVNLSDYKRALVKILDKYVDAVGVELLTSQIDIAEASLFQQSLDILGSDLAKAEAIAAQTAKVIQERYEDADPQFFERFSHKIRSILEDMKSGKLADAKALELLKVVKEEALTKKDNSLPEKIVSTAGADILYRNIDIIDDESKVRVVLGMVQIMKSEAIIDWQQNGEVQRIMMNKLDDFLYDVVKGEWKIELSPEQMKYLVDKAIDLAKKNHWLFSV